MIPCVLFSCSIVFFLYVWSIKMRSELIMQWPHENKVCLPEIDCNEWCTQTSVYNIVGIKA